ncbi:MAG: glucose-6-phosphate isomerase [Planctomycetes bacterium]|nr:glucose-6-phosphate isomerase [Planctomycetota bacterium]
MNPKQTSASSRWLNFKENNYIFSDLGFALDLSGIAMPAGFKSEMEPRLQKAYDGMQHLESGDIANPDEGRQVGHYWLRDPKLAPDLGVRAEIDSTIKRILAFSGSVHRGETRARPATKFTNVLVIGIGGSALGPQLAAAAMASPNDRMRMFFCDNTDPDGIDGVLTRIAAAAGGLAATLTIVTSKSGGTKETRNGMLEVANAYKRAGLEFNKHFVAITCPGSELDKLAIGEKWLDRFPLWDFVGGRTSIMSAVGLLPMALQGTNISEFLAGAKAMDAQTRSRETNRNPAALLALAWHHATGGAGKKDMVILPYKDRLELFSRYLQQLVMESLGKEKDLTGRVVEQGIAVYGNKGSTDQHAYVQQLREGVHNFFVTFVEVLKDRGNVAEGSAPFDVEPGVQSGDYLSAFLQGTRSALRDKGRESVTITLTHVDARMLGALIAMYERTVGHYASLVGINAYHQPGVEAGKKAAAGVLNIQNRILNELKRTAVPLTVDALAASVPELNDEQETIYKVLEHLAANARVRKSSGKDAYSAAYRII